MEFDNMVTHAHVALTFFLPLYGFLSKFLFDKINDNIKLIVDEEFHLPLGLAYCNYEFDKWDPKVTTLPGLYVITNLFLGTFKLCTTYWLRSISLMASVINILLLYAILNVLHKKGVWKNVISSINMALLPPIYFFSHLYYTDIVSITAVLSLLLCCLRRYHYLASLFGLLAILIRQTNVLWVIFACGYFVSKEVYAAAIKTGNVEQVRVPLKKLRVFSDLFRGKLWVTLRRLSTQFWLYLLCYVALLFSFVLFVYLNGSIVVGDKSAHQTTIHLSQLFYYSLFCLLFAWPHFITELPNFFRFVKHHKIVTLITVIICLFVVHFNTLVHPYLLADNRHYMFYIWNRFYGRYYWFRYVVVPLYVLAIYIYFSKIWKKDDVVFFLLFVPCSIIYLITQRLIEIRYFFMPYILFRLQLNNVSPFKLLLEFLTYIALNYVTFNIFFEKDIVWDNYDYPQKLIW